MLVACKECGSDKISVEMFCDISYVICKSCKNTTSDCETLEDAVQEWNNNNKPKM